MRIIKYDARSETLSLEPENFEDLWHLMKIVNKDDIVISKSIRRFRSEGEARSAGEKKEVTVELLVDRAELHKHANILRVIGKIIGGFPEEYIQKGSFHTIDIEPGYVYKLRKLQWTTYEKDRLKDAQKSAKRPTIRIVIMDDKLANVATLRGYGVDFDFEMQSRTSKRDDAYEEKIRRYFAEIEKVIADSKKVLVAGPGFTTESFRDYLKNRNPALLKKVTIEHTSTAEKSGVYELVKSGAIKKMTKEDRVSTEFEKMEKFMAEKGKGSGLAVKGEDEVREAISYGAVGELFVLDDFVRKDPSILDEAKAKGVAITVFTSEEEPWKRLKKFGGLVGILRFKIK
jgi:mRNA surveillance protein pelota